MLGLIIVGAFIGLILGVVIVVALFFVYFNYLAVV